MARRTSRRLPPRALLFWGDRRHAPTDERTAGIPMPPPWSFPDRDAGRSPSAPAPSRSPASPRSSGGSELCGRRAADGDEVSLRSTRPGARAVSATQRAHRVAARLGGGRDAAPTLHPRPTLQVPLALPGCAEAARQVVHLEDGDAVPLIAAEQPAGRSAPMAMRWRGCSALGLVYAVWRAVASGEPALAFAFVSAVGR